jgi:hypothetical protein
MENRSRIYYQEQQKVNTLVPIDHSAMRVHQSVLIFILILAFFLNQPLLVGFACLVMFIGAIVIRKPGFGLLYTAILKPLGIVKPDIIPDNREPHLFAQGIGSVFLLASSLAFLAGIPILGWTLSWIVTALAALNLFAGICVGCAMYYWFNHLHIPGFNRSIPPGTFPGKSPSRTNTPVS